MNRFTKVAPDKQIHLLMIKYNIFRRLSSIVRNVLTTRWSLLQGNFCTSKAVSHNLTSYKNNISRCFALQVAFCYLDHFSSVIRTITQKFGTWNQLQIPFVSEKSDLKFDKWWYWTHLMTAHTIKNSLLYAESRY